MPFWLKLSCVEGPDGMASLAEAVDLRAAPTCWVGCSRAILHISLVTERVCENRAAPTGAPHFQNTSDMSGLLVFTCNDV